jgi:cell division protein FtsL
VLAARKQNFQAAEAIKEQKLQQELQIMQKARAKKIVIKNDRAMIAFITAFILAIFFCCVAAEAKIGGVGYEINTTKSTIAELEEKCQLLELEVEKLRSLDRIEQYAINNLGMVCIESSDIIYLDYENNLKTAKVDDAQTSQGSSAQSADERAVASVAGEEKTASDNSFLKAFGTILENYLSKSSTAANS